MILAIDTETVPAGLELGPGLVERAQQRAAERLAETDGRTDFLKPHEHRIVAVGFASIDDKTARVEAAAGPNEPELLATVLEKLVGHPTLVGWHTSGFDLPVVRYRALAHQVNAATLYAGDKQYDRYDYRYGDVHIDLMDRLAGHGASAGLKLSEAAALCGLPAKPIATGNQVVELVELDLWSTVHDYVANDAATTLAIYLRWRYTTGKLAIGHYRRSVKLLAEACRGQSFDAGLSDALTAWVTPAVAV